MTFYKTVACGFNGFIPKVCCNETLINKLNKDHNIFVDNKNNEYLNYKDINRYEVYNLKEHNYEENGINKYCYVNKKNKESKIVGGITAAIGLFPWMAKLGYTGRSMKIKFEILYKIKTY